MPNYGTSFLSFFGALVVINLIDLCSVSSPRKIPYCILLGVDRHMKIK